MRRSPETLVVVAVLAAVLGASAWCAHRDVAANQAGFDAFVQSGRAPPAPPAISGATLTIQERL